MDDGQEVLGDSLIPVINRLQDIFSQVRDETWSAFSFDLVALAHACSVNCACGGYE